MEWFTQIGPLEGFGHGAVEIGGKVQDLVAEVRRGDEVTAPQQLADQDAEPKFDQVNANAIDWTGRLEDGPVSVGAVERCPRAQPHPKECARESRRPGP